MTRPSREKSRPATSEAWTDQGDLSASHLPFFAWYNAMLPFFIPIATRLPSR